MPAYPLLSAGARHAGHNGRSTTEQPGHASKMRCGKAGDDRRDLQGEQFRAAPAAVLVIAQDVPELAVQRVQRDRDHVRSRAADLAHDLRAATADGVAWPGPGTAYGADAGACGGARRIGPHVWPGLPPPPRPPPKHPPPPWPHPPPPSPP